MIKFHHKLEDIEDKDEQERVLNFIATFRQTIGSNPDYVIRSPGRINLIGDHIDYHGFSVLPMAIQNSILLGFSTTKKTISTSPAGDSCVNYRGAISIRNSDPITYPIFESTHGGHTFAHGSQLDKSHQWHHYVLCGYHGVLANQILDIEPTQVFAHSKDIANNGCLMEDKKLMKLNETSIDIFVDSNLPSASGLSSSSALVCASALATELFLHDNYHHNDSQSCPSKGRLAEIDTKTLAEKCSKFEHLVGTHGGGMDQAVIMTAQEGYAKHVEFRPQFNCNNVRLPEQVVWLVSHCGVSYPKAATSGFNCRVLETKLAAALIIKTLKPDTSSIELDHTISLARVREELFASNESASDIISILRAKVFHDGGHELGINEICSRLDMSRDQLIEKFQTSEQFLNANNLNQRVNLLKRIEHVLEEAERVTRFKLICDTSNQDIKQLGQLMTDSHISLRDKYECSHPALDKLVEISLAAGALGARLTGAGWGGCIVSMVEASQCNIILNELKKVSKFTFQTEPRAGCTIIRLDNN